MDMLERTNQRCYVVRRCLAPDIMLWWLVRTFMVQRGRLVGISVWFWVLQVLQCLTFFFRLSDKQFCNSLCRTQYCKTEAVPNCSVRQSKNRCHDAPCVIREFLHCPFGCRSHFCVTERAVPIDVEPVKFSLKICIDCPNRYKEQKIADNNRPDQQKASISATRPAAISDMRKQRKKQPQHRQRIMHL